MFFGVAFLTPGDTRRHEETPGDIQQTLRKHPGGTQETPRSTQEHPGAPRITQEHPRDTQETPRRHPGGTQKAPRKHPEAPRAPDVILK